MVRHVTVGVPSAAASKRYSAASDTMYTPPVSSTAKELPIGSPVAMECTAPVPGSTVPTMPLADANQIRPDQSGSADRIASPEPTAPLTS